MPSPADSILQDLRATKALHIELGKYVLTGFNGSLYPLDFLAAAVINRSIALIDGFSILLDARNLIAAAPLLRLQIDNCLRFSAAWLVKDPHEFATAVLQGVPVRKQRSMSGELMTDAFLVRQLSQEHPWVERVYDRTSGYIHLSETHIFSAVRSGADERTLEIVIGQGGRFATDDLLEEAAQAFAEATEVLLDYVRGWGYTKDNPQRVRRGPPVA
jgi:hypothetical protein